MLRKYWVLLKVNWQVIVEYRAGMLIWVLANTLPLVMMAVWLTIAADGPVGAYDAKAFVAYYLALLLVRQLTTVWVAWELDNDIRLGELAPKLLRPMNPIHSHIAMHLGDKLFRLITVVPFILLVIYFMPGLPYQADPATVALFLLSLALTLAIRFLAQYCIGLLSFWTTQSLAINEMLYAAMLMFGGVIAPLEIFPPALQVWADRLPFRFMLSLPVEIVMGRVRQGELAWALGVQLIWLLAALLLYALLWRAGLKRFSAVGA